jgi:hypothetical protein
MDNINAVTLLMGLILMFYLIKGITNRFSGDEMFYSLINIIHNFLFLISVIISIFITNKIFFDRNSSEVFKGIFSLIPGNISSYLVNAGLITYIIISPGILILMFSILINLSYYADKPIKIISNFICDNIKKTNKAVRILAGLALEIPKAAITVITLVLILSLVNTYYPANPISEISKGSKTYKYVYIHAVSPIMSTSLGKGLPAFLWNSVQRISDGVEESKVLNQSLDIKNIGLIRFQLETKSDDKISNTARKVVGSETDDKKKAYLLYEWIGSNISYDWDKYNDIVNNKANKDKFGAIPAFYTRKGICEDYSDLYAAMAKSVGLKVRTIVGQGHTQEGWGGHAWNEVYISKENSWIPLDTTWAKSGNYFDNKDFYTEHRFEAVAGEW